MYYEMYKCWYKKYPMEGEIILSGTHWYCHQCMWPLMGKIECGYCKKFFKEAGVLIDAHSPLMTATSSDVTAPRAAWECCGAQCIPLFWMMIMPQGL